MELSPSFKLLIEILDLPMEFESLTALERDVPLVIARVLSGHKFEIEKILNSKPKNGTLPMSLSVGDFYQLFMPVKFRYGSAGFYDQLSYELRLANCLWLPDEAFKGIIDAVTAKVELELAKYSFDGSYTRLITLASMPVRYDDKIVPATKAVYSI